MSRELLPCRFCGNIDFIYGSNGDEENFDNYVCCKNCGHEVASFYADMTTFRDARDLWNARNEKHNPFIEEKL